MRTMGWLLIWGLGSCTGASDPESGQPEEDDAAPPESTGDWDAMSELEYLEANGEASCELWERCGRLESRGFSDVEECADTLGVEFEGGVCEEYDADAAQACIDAIARMTCEELDSGQGAPAVCDEVCD